MRKSWIRKVATISWLLAVLFVGVAHGADVGQISIAGAGTGGTVYIITSGFADLFQKQLHIPSIPEVTGGSVENARLLHAGKVEMVAMQLDVMLDALEGNNATFKEPIKMSSLVPMYPNVIQFITLKDSHIGSFADLKGKKVAVGAAGSGILATSRLLLKEMGLSMDDIQPQYLSFVEITDAFRDGQLDAALINTAAPAPWLVDLETTHAIKLISFSKEDVERLTKKYTYFAPFTITEDTYNSLTEDVNTFALWMTLAVADSFPEQVAYDATKLIFENVETLKTVHAAAAYVVPESVKSITVPFHPGAARYLKEKGINVAVK